LIYIGRRFPVPKTAKIFKNGRSQAIRLPADFRFSGREVFIEKKGNMVILRPKPIGWDDFFDSKSQVPDDFLAGRIDTPPEDKELF
jgi:antitoxin VapB